MGSKIPKIDPRMRQIGTSGVHFQNDDQGAPGVLNLQRTSISNYHQSYGTFSPTSWALRGLQLHACYRLTSQGETPRTPPMITPAAVSEYSDAQVCQSCHSSHITCAVLRSLCLGACVTRVRVPPPPPPPPSFITHSPPPRSRGKLVGRLFL